jgi:hypothetical protein
MRFDAARYAPRCAHENVCGTGLIALTRRQVASIAAASMRRMMPRDPRDQKAKRGGDGNWRLSISAVAALAELAWIFSAPRHSVPSRYLCVKAMSRTNTGGPNPRLTS